MIISQSLGFLNTDPLWNEEQFDIEQFEFQRLELSSFEPQVLPDNLRLGHQMEYVFKQLIEYSERYDVVLYNLPIRDENRTLGEIDFILRDKVVDKLIHVELTYKFYIIDPEIKNPIRSLIGPNRQDSFHQKMEKIKKIQFPLLHSKAGIQALSNLNIDHMEVAHQCCFKAQLFQPYGSNTTDIGSLNEACVIGYWVRIDDLRRSKFRSSEYYIPSKSEWPIQVHTQVDWMSHVEVLEAINRILIQERSPMVWRRKSKVSFEKFFVVWW